MSLKEKAKTSQEIAFDWDSIIRKAKGATYDKQYKSYTQKRNKKWVRLDDVVALLDEVTKQIQKKLIRVDKLSNPEEIFTITKRKFCEDFNREIQEVLGILDGEKKK